MVYLVAGRNYGMGKSKTAISTALFMSQTIKRNVLLIDADPAKMSSSYLKSYKEDCPVINLSVETMAANDVSDYLIDKEDLYSDVIVDIGIGEGLKESLLHSDRLLIPINSNDQALWIMWVLTSLEKSLENTLDRSADFEVQSFFIDDLSEDVMKEDLKEILRRSAVIDYVEDFKLNGTSIQTMMLNSPDSIFKSDSLKEKSKVMVK